MGAADVQKLREQTGAGIMDCKKALDEAGGDFDKATKILKEKGILKAGSKGGRDASAGYLEAYIHAGRVGVLLEINAETDFVTKSEDFQECSKNIAMHIAALAPENAEELLSQPFVKDASLTIEDYIKTIIAKVGENIQVSRFCRYEV